MVQDRLYAEPRATLGSFCFDEQVARVFTDMINRSVPGYAALLPLLGVLAGHYAQPASRCYDLGCALGAASLVLAGHLPPDCRIVAVDNAPAMLAACRTQLARAGLADRIETHCQDLQSVPIVDASVVVLNFTLQFIPVAQRLSVLQGIRAGLRPGGVLLLSEKMASVDPVEQRWYDELHARFKRANGYSQLEIAQKRTALERVLLPEPLTVHRQRLRAAGFAGIQVWFQCLHFVSLAAWTPP